MRSLNIQTLVLLLYLGSLSLIVTDDVPVCSEETLFDMTFDYCMNDAQCKYKFEMSPVSSRDRVKFRYLVNNELKHKIRIDVDRICNSTETLTMWMDIIKFYDFCNPNEIVDPDNGCICRGDKTCVVTEATHFGITVGIQILLMLVTEFTIIYFSVSIVNALRGNRDSKLKKKSDMSTILG